MATRYMGLDIHKEYLVACAVDRDQNVVYGRRRVTFTRLQQWIETELTHDDTVALEMTTNTWTLVDLLTTHVKSVTVVHPPQVKLITKARVMTDRKASRILAKLHAANLLPPVWIPPKEVRELRALVAQRRKLVRLMVQAKHRLQAALHRHHIAPPQGDAYCQANRTWWLALPLGEIELFRVEYDLETMDFAKAQVRKMEQKLGKLLLEDERAPLLNQLPGIGDIKRFPTARKLVGYAGLGAKVHASGKTHRTGSITKTGRRDLRHAMVEAAQAAARSHPHWKKELARLEPRLGRKKAIVAIARKLLVAVWHVLTKGVADRYRRSAAIAQSFFRLAYRAGVRNLPDGMRAIDFTRQQMDRLGIGAELETMKWGSKTFKLPPSKLASPSG